MAAAFALSACGGAGGKTVALRLANPAFADIYVQLRGPAGVVDAFTRHFTRTGRLIVAPKVRGQEACSFTRRHAGQKLTIRVYGDNRFAPTVCSGISSGLRG
jgi:hypothetical protein